MRYWTLEKKLDFIPGIGACHRMIRNMPPHGNHSTTLKDSTQRMVQLLVNKGASGTMETKLEPAVGGRFSIHCSILAFKVKSTYYGIW